MASNSEYIGTISSKGQVTIPVEIRRALGLKSQTKLIFRLAEGSFKVEPLPMTLEEAFGSVAPLTRPEDFQAIREIAREERAERAAAKGRE